MAKDSTFCMADKENTPPFLDISNDNDISHAETNEEFLVHFCAAEELFPKNDTEACDRAMRTGSCEKAVHRLRAIVIPSSIKRKARKGSRDETGLQIAVICSALARMMACSDATLKKYVPSFADDLGKAVPAAVRFALEWDCDTTSRFVALGCSVQIMRRVAPACVECLFDFAQTLSLLLGHNIPIDVRVDAACTLTTFLGVDKANMSVHCKVEQEASSIISVLSTAALTHNKSSAAPRLQSMLLLAKDPIISSKLRRRRCVMIAVTKQLKTHDPEKHHLALEIISFLLRSEEADSKCTVAENMHFLVQEMGTALGEECCRLARIQIIRVLVLAFSVSAVSLEQKLNVLDKLYEFLRADSVQPNLQIEAVSAFLAGLNRINGFDDFLEELSVLVVSPLAAVRQKVLRELDCAFFWHARALSEHPNLSDLLDSLCILISNGSPEDCADAMQLSRQIAAEEAAKVCMCKHRLFLKRLVSLVSTSPVKNRPAFINGVEIILDLLGSEEHLAVFLSFPSVLPWMVGLANRTSEDTLKERLVSVILRFARAKLDMHSSKSELV